MGRGGSGHRNTPIASNAVDRIRSGKFNCGRRTVLTKLTLSMETHVIAKAKRLAKARGLSVSAMFREFVASLETRTTTARRIGPLTRQARGLAKIPADKTDRQLIEQALKEKFGF
jgi:hypothetical protein